MDALAGYGSDSSSSSSHKNEAETTTEQDEKKEGLSGLLASYTDDDDDDDDDVEHNGSPKTNKTNAQNGEQSANENKNKSKPDDVPIDNEPSTKDEVQQPPQKKRRKRRWDNPPAEERVPSSDKRSSSLPIPLLAESLNDNNNVREHEASDCKALILFDKDYTAKLQQPNGNKTEEAQKDLIEKLNKIHQTFHSSHNGDGGENSKQKQSFATHLKSKKEFGNPHMFPSVVEHFGIDPMGTNLPSSSLWDPKEFKEFEYFDRIAVAELQSRERAAEQRALEHASQQQVDQQVQMAMGGAAAVGRG